MARPSLQVLKSFELRLITEALFITTYLWALLGMLSVNTIFWEQGVSPPN